MRIGRFVTTTGEACYGELVGAREARPLVGDLYEDRRFADETVDVAKFLAPVAPPNIFAIGRNYAAHVSETGASRPAAPLVFMKQTTSLNVTGGVIVLPDSAPEQVDFEAELAIVIGRVAHEVSPAEAPAYVLGYTCANDVTARDCQAGDGQWIRAKGFDTFCPLGPWLVTREEIDPTDLAIRSRLNGETMQEARTSAMMFGPFELISYLSHQFTLLPGTVILTGTPEGVGFVRQPPVFLREGDEIEVEIEGLGTLRNRVMRAPRPV